MRRKRNNSVALLAAIFLIVSLMCGSGLSVLAENPVSSQSEAAEESESTDYVSVSDSGSTADGSWEPEETKPEETEAGQTEPEQSETDKEEKAQEGTLPEGEEQTESPLYEQRITASGSGDSVITLSGMLPEEAYAEAYPVAVDENGGLEGQRILAAYDITIYDGAGNIYQPQTGKIKVEIADDAVEKAAGSAETLFVYHVGEGTAPEAVDGAAATDSGVVFEADSFSVYVVTTPESHFTHTYYFYDSEGNRLLDCQILSNGEMLTEPKSPEHGDHQIFSGWYTAKEGGEKFSGFGNTVNGLTASVTTNLYARYEKAYYVFYMSGDKVFYTQTYGDGERILTEDVPYNTGNEDTALVGWATAPDAEEPEKEIFIEGEDVTLYPVVKNAHWITYDVQGGSAVEPVYVLTGAVTAAPEAPKRAGYEFGGWYTDEACLTPFSFGGMLEKSITLYAKWNAKTVDYTVIYWQQNPDDNGYSYAESMKKNGMTGTETSVSAETGRYEGFRPSTENLIRQQEIAGDGSTVVNVYYDRQEFTIQFYEWKQSGIWKGSWQAIGALTITAKYGQNISSLWPSRRTELGTTYPSNWLVDPDDSVYQSGISTMPLGGAGFYRDRTSGRNTIRTEFYLEGLDGKYVLDHMDDFKSDSDTSWRTTANDYYDIKGFTVNMSLSPEVGKKAEKLGNRIYGWRFYYDRNAYEIDFMNDGSKDAAKTYLYEADISSAGYIPEAPEGKEDYLFEGWYENELCLGEPYDFTGKTMPAGNMVLYAKWTAPSYKVSFDLNGTVSEGNDYDDQTVEKGGQAVRPEDPVWEGHSFAGWTRNGKPFNFNTQITEDTKLTAQWLSDDRYRITYDPGDGAGDNAADDVLYAGGAEAKVLKMPDTWTAPEGSNGFICWNTKADGTGTDYYPGDVYSMPDSDVTLFARWAYDRRTTLTYDFNGGTDGAGETSYVEEISTPNGAYEIGNLGKELVRNGYVFIGWTLEKEGTGTLLQAGTQIQVDTLEPESNILYAQWEKIIVPPTGIRNVSGPFLVMLLAGILATLGLWFTGYKKHGARERR